MRRFSCYVALLLVCAQPLHATVLLPAEFREIVAGSQIIVYGLVTDVTPEWSADRRRIDTVVTVAARSYLKGGPGSTVTFRVPGGQIGRYRNVMVGAPAFQAGEETVLFLSASGPAVAHVFGLSQGVFRVRVEARTGRRVVIPPVLTASGDEPQAVVRGDRTRRQLPLDTFAATVREAMAKPGAAR
jgi:hypothetical protein